MVEPNPFSSEWYTAEPPRQRRVDAEWFTNDRRVSEVFVLLLVVVTVLVSR